ncbi:uncharacterized protein UTRI_03449 [Ustilago trichophora]|uniref:Uncharacterized protein n=1 Tax=Ustilago trichophora TaxID=86804 RepID=A0A5C3E404_9BASI|nr:uncharacterized protein UTRI_03449 [Ustilago trichophora]
MKLQRKRKAVSLLDQSANWPEGEELGKQLLQQPSVVQSEPSSQKYQNPRVTLTGPTSIRISAAAVSGHVKPSMQPRRRTSIAPNPRFRPFLDVVTRRASKEAASVIDPRISREAIHHHPTHPDVLLVSPPCWPCSRLGTVCDRASWRCGQCVSAGDRCTREDHWHFFNAATGKSIPWDKISLIRIINKQIPLDKITSKQTAPTEIAPKVISARGIAPKQVPTKNVVHKDGIHKEVVRKDIALKDMASKNIAPRKTVSKRFDPDKISPAVVNPTDAILKEGLPKDFIPKQDVQKHDVQNRKRIPDEIAPDKVESINIGSKGLPEDSDEHRIPRHNCLFWASSINDMRICDPFFPPKGASIGISRSGTVTALLLERHHAGKSPHQSCLVANLPAAAIGLRVYYLFNDPGKPYLVANNSVVTLKVMFWRICYISSVERYDDSSAKLTLIWNQNAKEREVSTLTTLDIANLLPQDMSEQTLLGFRCSVCGRANRKPRLEVASCLHCSASFMLTNKATEKSLSHRRKMELSFTGSRSDLGKANMVLSDDDLTKRSVSTFTDGSRICTYYIAESSTNVRSDAGAKVLPDKYALHHVLKPGRSDEVSVEALAPPTIPSILALLRSASSAWVPGLKRNFESRDMLWVLIRRTEAFVRASLPSSTLSRQLLERLSIPSSSEWSLEDSSFFPATSAHFGILCPDLLRKQPVTVDQRLYQARQSQDAVVGRTELLEAVELELSSKGVSLWAIAHFSAADSTLNKDQSSSQRLHKEQPLAVQDHCRSRNL